MPKRADQETAFATLWAQYGRAVLSVCVLTLFMHDIFGAHGYLAMRHTRQEIERVQADITHLNEDNQKLVEEVKLLKSDPATIERIARCELGRAKPSEVIITIPGSGQPESCEELLH